MYFNYNVNRPKSCFIGFLFLDKGTTFSTIKECFNYELQMVHVISDRQQLNNDFKLREESYGTV